MAEFPALPLFTDAFIGDTTHLTAAQTGGYLMLLMIAWRTSDCALPDDDQKLARWARMDLRAWKNNKSLIMDFWTMCPDGKWRQGRLSDERIYVDAKSKSSSQAAHTRWLKNKDSYNANASFSQCERNAPTPTPTPSKKEYDAAFSACAKTEFQKVYDFGCSIFPLLAPKNTIAISKWIEQGCDAEKDIIPTLQRFAGRNIAGWAYFSQMVIDAKREREKPLPQPSDKQSKGSDNGKSKWASAADAYIAKHSQSE